MRRRHPSIKSIRVYVFQKDPRNPLSRPISGGEREKEEIINEYRVCVHYMYDTRETEAAKSEKSALTCCRERYPDAICGRTVRVTFERHRTL